MAMVLAPTTADARHQCSAIRHLRVRVASSRSRPVRMLARASRPPARAADAWRQCGVVVCRCAVIGCVWSGVVVVAVVVVGP